MGLVEGEEAGPGRDRVGPAGGTSFQSPGKLGPAGRGVLLEAVPEGSRKDQGREGVGLALWWNSYS